MSATQGKLGQHYIYLCLVTHSYLQASSCRCLGLATGQCTAATASTTRSASLPRMAHNFSAAGTWQQCMQQPQKLHANPAARRAPTSHCRRRCRRRLPRRPESGRSCWNGCAASAKVAVSFLFPSCRLLMLFHLLCWMTCGRHMCCTTPTLLKPMPCW